MRDVELFKISTISDCTKLLIEMLNFFHTTTVINKSIRVYFFIFVRPSLPEESLVLIILHYYWPYENKSTS